MLPHFNLNEPDVKHMQIKFSVHHSPSSCDFDDPNDIRKKGNFN